MKTNQDAKLLADCALWHAAQVPYAEALDAMSVTVEGSPAFEAAEARRAAAVALSDELLARITETEAVTPAGQRAKAVVLLASASDGAADDAHEGQLGLSIARDLVAV